MKFSKEVTLNKFIQIACLPPAKSSTYPGENVDGWIVGWGTIWFGGPTSATLKNAKVTIYPGKECASVSPQLKQDWNVKICAGNILGGVDTCQGDSGGSLFSIDKIDGKLKYVSVGITSYGEFKSFNLIFLFLF